MENKILDVLIDPDNLDNVFFTSSDGITYEFEQIAVIPYNEEIYALLRPVENDKGLDVDSVIPFKVCFDAADEVYLAVDEDEEANRAVYQIYRDLLKKSQG